MNQYQANTQLAGIWVPLHGDQQHTGTLVMALVGALSMTHSEILANLHLKLYTFHCLHLLWGADCCYSDVAISVITIV